MVCMQQMILLAAILSVVSKGLTVDAGDWRSFEATKRVVLGNVDPDCTFLSTTNSLFVNAPKQQLRTDLSSEISARLRNSTMLLCQHVSSTDHQKTPTQGQIAVTTTANTVDYLTSKKPLKYSSMSRWSALTSKLEYGNKHGFPVFVAIGQLDLLQRNFRSPVCLTGMKWAHIGLKIIGIIAMLILKPELAAGVYIDVDACIVDMSVLPSEYLRLSQQADLIATSNWRRPVLINGGALIFRNTRRSLDILSSWWAYRCYKHDQPGLWRAVFEQWPSWEAGSTAREDFWQQRHLTTMHYFTHNHHKLRAKAGLQTRWKCEGTCDWLYRETGCLKEPLEMPGVLLLPTLPLDDGAIKIKALQHFSGLLYYNESNQWLCHTDNQAGKACAPSEKDLKEQVLQRSFNRCQLCKIAVKTLKRYGCRKSKEMETYLCNCEQMLLPEYTFLKNQSKVAAYCAACSNKQEQHHLFDKDAHLMKGFRRIPHPTFVPP